MRIVDLKTFRALPAGVVFAKYAPCYFDGLQVKGETWEHDFLVSSHLGGAIDYSSSEEFVESLDRAVATGCSLAMDFSVNQRDGCFNDKQLFAIYEPDDLRGMMRVLETALEVMS